MRHDRSTKMKGEETLAIRTDKGTILISQWKDGDVTITKDHGIKCF